MLRNILAATLRNLARNKFYAAISIFGLAVGLCTAILMGLVIRNELTHDHFIPGHERTYIGLSILLPQGAPPQYNTAMHHGTAGLLRLQHPEIEAVTRLADQTLTLSHGETEAREKFSWADPNFFQIVPLPVFAGDLKASLKRADGVVLTRRIARKYFGRENPIGETLLLDHQHPMTVTAVIEDLPANATHIENEIFAAGLAANSVLTEVGDAPPDPNATGFFIDTRTYLRLKPGASIDRLQSGMADLTEQLWPQAKRPGLGGTMEFVRIDRLHLDERLSPGTLSRISMMVVIGVLVLLVAAINFVNLLTARSARRAVEVGVRKIAGAVRPTLTLQFLGESLIYVALALCLAFALVELMLPHVNAFMGTGAVLNYTRDASVFVAIGVGALVLGVLAGVYPALVLSAFKPATILKGWVGDGAFKRVVRQALVVAQFAVLIGLAIAAIVIYQQRIFATTDALRVNTDQILMIGSRCDATLKNELRSLPGVSGAYCVSEGLLTGLRGAVFKMPDGGLQALPTTPVEFGLFGAYGLKPLAGRFPEEESVARDPSYRPPYVINETAVRRLGFSSPEAAIGQTIARADGTIIDIAGVVSDFSLLSVEKGTHPTVYYVAPPGGGNYQFIAVKLAGRDIPETLAAIGNVWSAAGNAEPIDQFFLDEYLQNLYVAVLQQAHAFAIFSVIAVLLACLGQIGLAASTAERRTKEIGIRKATGASSTAILRLLSWEFVKPVLWANLIAWPVAYWAMQRWLEGFALHIDLKFWMFAVAGGVAIAIALATVSINSWLIARSKPVHALRYE